MEDEQKFESLDEMLDFLVADEQEAIDGYDAVLGQVEDEHVKEELIKLRTEEQAHKEFLELLKTDPTAVYVDPLAEDEDKKDSEEAEEAEGEDEPVEESLTESGTEDNAEADTAAAEQNAERADKDWDELDWPEPAEIN